MTEKMVMENVAIFTALKAKSVNIKKELKGLRNEVRSTYLSKKSPPDIDIGDTLPKAIVHVTSLAIPANEPASGQKNLRIC